MVSTLARCAGFIGIGAWRLAAADQRWKVPITMSIFDKSSSKHVGDFRIEQSSLFATTSA